MKRQLVWFPALCCAFTLVLFRSDSYRARAQSQAKQVAGENGLSTPEEDLLKEINQARARPDVYATYLEGLKPFFKGKEYQPTGQYALTTEEGWTAVEDAIRFLRAAKPQPALNLSQGLRLAAIAHVKDQSGTGATGHQGSDKGLIEERVKAFGSWQGGIGENLSYGAESARERTLTWLIDDGFATRGHRKRLLSGDYKVAGLSCGPHPQWGTMCVIEFAGAFIDLQPAKTGTSKPVNSGTTKHKPKSSHSKKNAKDRPR